MKRATRGRRRSLEAEGEPLCFLQLLWAIDHGLRSMSKGMQSRLGITGPQRLVLRMVGRVPGITSSQRAPRSTSIAVR